MVARRTASAAALVLLLAAVAQAEQAADVTDQRQQHKEDAAGSLAEEARAAQDEVCTQAFTVLARCAPRVDGASPAVRAACCTLLARFRDQGCFW